MQDHNSNMADRAPVSHDYNAIDDEWNEPTIPSFRVPVFVAKKGPWLNQVRAIALAGLLASVLVTVGGMFGNSSIIGLAGVVMVAANIRAWVN